MGWRQYRSFLHCYRTIIVLSGINFFVLVQPFFLSGAEPTQIQLRDWRLVSQGIKAVLLEKYAGRDFVVQANFPGRPEGRTTFDTPHDYATAAVYKVERGPKENKPPLPQDTGFIKMAEHKLHRSLEPWIPPYIGIDAVEIRFAILPTKRQGKIKMWLEIVRRDPKTRRASIKQPITLTQLPAGKWTELTIPVHADLTHRLAEINLLLTREEDACCEFFYTSPQVITRRGEKYDLLNPSMPSYLQGMKTPLMAQYLPNGFRKHPKRLPIFFGVPGCWNFIHEDAVQLSDMAEFMAKHFPEHDLVMSFSRIPEPEMAKLLVKFPENIFYQNQKATHGTHYPALFDALPRNWQGQAQKKTFNSIVATHPLLQTALKDEIDYSASLGFNNFCSYDYVWPYLGGLWGYDNASIAAFRQDLAGADEGLEIISETDSSCHTIHFWDYFKDYHGKIFTPDDLGLRNWQEFIPPLEKDASQADSIGQRRLAVFLLLRQYEWLRQAQRFNQWAANHNGTYDYLLNGDDWIVANDHVYLMRLKNSGIIKPEYFIGFPGALEYYFRTIGRYIRTGKRIGKLLGYVVETGNGGEGQPYWDPYVGYTVSYILSAQGFNCMHYDVPPTWVKRQATPLNATNLNLFMAQAMAFRQTHLEKLSKLSAPEILNVFQRNTGIRRNNTDNWDFFLVNNQINYEETDQQELPLMLNSARVIFFSPPAVQKSSVEELKRWLKLGGKTLILHSYIPFHLGRGNADPGKLLDNPDILTAPPLFPGFERGKFSGQSIINQSNGEPLLTRIKLSKDSQIYYLTKRVRHLSSEERDRLAQYLVKTLSLPLLQTIDPDANSMITRFRGENFQVINLWNRKLVLAANNQVADWLRIQWRRYSRFVGPEAYLFKWHHPGARANATISMEKPGKYLVYHFLSDREEILKTDKNNCLVLLLNDVLTDIFYIAEDTPAFRNTLNAIRENRRKVTPFLTEATKTYNK